MSRFIDNPTTAQITVAIAMVTSRRLLPTKNTLTATNAAQGISFGNLVTTVNQCEQSLRSDDQDHDQQCERVRVDVAVRDVAGAERLHHAEQQAARPRAADG